MNEGVITLASELNVHTCLESLCFCREIQLNGGVQLRLTRLQCIHKLQKRISLKTVISNHPMQVAAPKMCCYKFLPKVALGQSDSDRGPTQ